jgi:phenylacetate-CoA ligase
MNKTPWQELVKLPTLIRSSRKSIETYQNVKLRNLVRDVWSSNEFYRGLWEQSGLDVSRFRGVEDLQRLPLVTKQQARELTGMTRENPPRCGRIIWHKTSGSTGEPFGVARSWHEERFLTAVRSVLLRELGFRAHLRQARIRVPPEFDWLDDRPLRLLNRLGLFRSRIFSCYEPPDVIWKQLSGYKPEILMGYSETVARVARFGLDSGRRAIRPRLVLVGGELCTALMRRQISEAFGSPVYDTYATTEFNLIAWTCPESGLLHICDPTVVVEVVNDAGEQAGEGESGRIVVTALHSRVMPFVRFVLGDRVAKGPAPCPCGAPYATLQSVDGREIDRLRLNDGTTLHAYVLLNALLESGADGWMRQYQLIQDQPGAIEVHIWPRRDPAPGALEALAAQLETRTAGTPIHIKLVDRMELDRNGKFHLCRCSL